MGATAALPLVVVGHPLLAAATNLIPKATRRSFQSPTTKWTVPKKGLGRLLLADFPAMGRWVWDRASFIVGLVLVGGALAWIGWAYHLPASQRSNALVVPGFAVALTGVLVSAMALVVSLGRRPPARSVDTLAELLAEVVDRQWRRVAVERRLVTPEPIPLRWSLSDQVVMGSVAAAVGGPERPPAFPPLPQQARIVEANLRAGGGRSELYHVYAGLASGRVVVLGAPGGGKSGSAILLLLDALSHRYGLTNKQRTRVPVPVLLTTRGWDPHSASVRDWLCDRLVETYPLFQHRSGRTEAAALVDARDKVALILDGFDEMDQALRPAALEALSDAPFRIVVLSRSEEMGQALSAPWFVGAVVVILDAITGCLAAEYLNWAALGPLPVGWNQLLGHLREQPNSALTGGVSTPLALTLIRDTYGAGDDVSELLDSGRYSTRDHIEQHLIARVLPKAYTPQPGRPPPRYNIAQATQVLTFIASRMNQYHTGDFAWWQIPRWAPVGPRILVSVLAGGLIGALASWFMACLAVGFGYNFFHLGFGLGLGIFFGFVRGRGNGGPKQITNWRSVSFRLLFYRGFVYGLSFGVAAFFIVFMMYTAYAMTFGSRRQLPDIITGLIIALMAGLSLGLKREPMSGAAADESRSPRTRKSWLTGGSIALGNGLLIGLLVGLAGGLKNGLSFGLGSGLMFGSVYGVVFAVAYGLIRRLTHKSMFVLVEDERRPLGPRESWRNDRVLAVVAGIMVGLAMMTGYVIYYILVGLVNELGGVAPRTDFAHGLANGLIFGLVTVLVFGATSSLAWPTTISWLQLQCSRHIPTIALIPFLEDARDRGILRTIGAIYQFRHATLQDQLATQIRNPDSTTSSAANLTALSG